MDAFDDFDTESRWAHKTVLEVKRVLNRDKTSDDERSTSVIGIIDQTRASRRDLAITALRDGGLGIRVNETRHRSGRPRGVANCMRYGRRSNEVCK